MRSSNWIFYVQPYGLVLLFFCIQSSSRKIPLHYSNHRAELTCNPPGLWTVVPIVHINQLELFVQTVHAMNQCQKISLTHKCLEEIFHQGTKGTYVSLYYPILHKVHSFCGNPSCRRRTHCLGRAVPIRPYRTPARIGSPAKHLPRPHTPPMPCLTSMAGQR
jgi:hypothetical protein